MIRRGRLGWGGRARLRRKIVYLDVEQMELLNAVAEWSGHSASVIVFRALKTYLHCFKISLISPHPLPGTPSCVPEIQSWFDEIVEIIVKKKAERSLALLRDVLAKHKNPYLSWSGGKDSTVVLHLALQIMPRIDVIFVNSGVEFPEVVQFINQTKVDWGVNLSVVRPRATFWDVVRQYGYPLKPRGYFPSPLLLEGRRYGATKCCELLKKQPAGDYALANRKDLGIDGVTGAESYSRGRMFYKYGMYRQVKNPSLWRLSPIWDWTPYEVWTYMRIHDVPYTSYYKKIEGGTTARTGCWACTIGVGTGNTNSLREFYPDLWRTLLKSGLATELLRIRGVIGLNKEVPAETIDGYIMSRPCMFDAI